MVVAAPAGTRHKRLSPILRNLHADTLDCLQSNLAVLADLHHGTGTHLRLGARLRFEPGEPTLTDRLAQAAELIGLRVDQRWDGVDGPKLRELAGRHETVYVVADAYTMGWVPYAGNQHMEHSFVLTGTETSCSVADGYHNDTPWGSVRPGVWRLPSSEFDTSVTNAAGLTFTPEPLPALDVRAILAANARALTDAVPAMEKYVAAAGNGTDLDALVLDVWLLSRSRGLHAAWLRDSGLPAGDVDDADELTRSWLTLAAQTYIGARRAKRGGVLSPTILDQLDTLLRADVALANRLASGGTRAVVHDVLREILGLDAPLSGREPLRDLPGYNSFRLLDAIELAESRLRVTIDPDDLTAESLHDVDALCGLLAKAART